MPDATDSRLQKALQVVHFLRKTGGRGELARALRDLGELERRSDADAAREHYEEAVAIFREVDDPLRLAHTVRHLGDVHYEAGRAALAEPCFHEALSIYRGHPKTDPLDLANAIRSLAVLKGESEETGEAKSLWQEARDLYVTVGVEPGIAECDARIARLARREHTQP